MNRETLIYELFNFQNYCLYLHFSCRYCDNKKGIYFIKYLEKGFCPKCKNWFHPSKLNVEQMGVFYYQVYQEIQKKMHIPQELLK